MIDRRPSEVEWYCIFHGVVSREVNNRNFIDALEAEVHCFRSGLSLSLSWRQAGRTSVSKVLLVDEINDLRDVPKMQCVA